MNALNYVENSKKWSSFVKTGNFMIRLCETVDELLWTREMLGDKSLFFIGRDRVRGMAHPYLDIVCSPLYHSMMRKANMIYAGQVPVVLQTCLRMD